MGALGLSQGPGIVPPPMQLRVGVPIVTGALAPAGSSVLTHAVPSASGSDWTLYDETTTPAAIVDAVRGAQRVVNAEFFAVGDAGKGEDFTEALIDAARRGVEVNVIADMASLSLTPLGTFLRFRRKIERAGGTVKLTNTVPLVGKNPALQHVDHRKVVTVDGTVGFVGGMNFAKMSDGYHDSMVRLSGVPAARLAANQLDRWNRVGGAVTDGHRAAVTQALGSASLVPASSSEIAVLANAPEQRRYELSDAYLRLIRGAKERLWVSSPGFSDQEVIEELNLAAQRGVDVKILAPGTAPLGMPLFNWIGRSHLMELVGHGAEVYEIPEVLHRKLLISDDQVVLSSYNITGRSRLHDHEAGVHTSDPAFVTAIENTMRHDMGRATQLNSDRFTGIQKFVGDLIAQRLKFSY